MFDQFGDSPIVVANGPISEFALTAEGATFLAQSDSPETRTALAELTGAEPSANTSVVTLIDGRWSVVDAKFAEPTISITTNPEGPLRAVPVQVTISNPGSKTMTDASIRVRSWSPDRTSGVFIGSASVEVDGYGTQTLSFPWAPGRANDWTIEAEIIRSTADVRTGTNALIVHLDHVVTVPPGDGLPTRAAIEIGWPGNDMQRIMFMVGLIVIAGTVAFMSLRRRPIRS
jgi:hypothetical protein